MNTFQKLILLFTLVIISWTVSPRASWGKSKGKSDFKTYQIIELIPLGNAFDIKVQGRKKPLKIEEASKFDEETMQLLQDQSAKKASLQFRLKGDVVQQMKAVKP